MSQENGFDFNKTPEPSIKQKSSIENGSENDLEQKNITTEYLNLRENLKGLDAQYQEKRKLLQTLRQEASLTGALDTKPIEDAEYELNTIAYNIAGTQTSMNSLFDKLTDESKEKYLKESS